MFHQIITNKFLKALDRIEYGSIRLNLPDGQTISYQGRSDGVNVSVVIHDWRAFTSFAAKADIGLAESYRDGLWDVDNLSGLLLFGLQNQEALETYINGRTLNHLLSQFFYLFTRNTIKGSRRNIQAHYDLGNQFYRLWLDPTMSYSAALNVADHSSLAAAQRAKYDRIVGCLSHRPGRLLEIGCGWGGFLDQAAATTGHELKGITISKAQQAYAKNRLGSGAEVLLEDYRRQSGVYDHIVSIEMFEAVGEAYWKTYFSKLKSLLSPKGTAVIQTITIDDPYFDLYRKSGDMIRTFIFPGGMLPSISRFEAEAKRAGFKVGSPFLFGQDYARTVEVWLANFEMQLQKVRHLGFDEAFIRLWRFYLSSCIALFRHGRTNVMQVELAHG